MEYQKKRVRESLNTSVVNSCLGKPRGYAMVCKQVYNGIKRRRECAIASKEAYCGVGSVTAKDLVPS